MSSIENWASSGNIVVPSSDKIQEGFDCNDSDPRIFNFVVRNLIDLAKQGSVPDTAAPVAPSITGYYDAGDRTFYVEGVTEPLVAIYVTFPDNSTVIGYGNTDGSFGPVRSTVKQNSGLVYVKAVDSSGNESTIVSDYITNTGQLCPPTNVTFTTPSTGVNAGNVIVNARGEPGATVVLTQPNSTTSTALVDNDGNMTPIIFPISGQPTSIIQMEQELSNRQNEAIQLNYLQSVPPVAPVIVSVTTDNNTAIVTFTAQASVTYEVTWPTNPTTVETGTATGADITVTSPVNVPEGAMVITLTSPSSLTATTTVFIGDVISPNPPVVTGSFGPKSSIQLAGSTDPGNSINITLPSGSFIEEEITLTPNSSGVWGQSFEGSNSGNASIVAVDSSGNESDPTIFSFTDSNPPAPPIVNYNFNTDGTLQVYATSELNAVLNITVPDGSVSQVDTVPSSNGLVGEHTLTTTTQQANGTVSVTAQDASGNISVASTINVIDSAAPGVPTASVSQLPSGNVRVSGTGEPGATVHTTFTDATTKSAVVAVNGNWGPVISDSPDLPSGYLEIYQVDINGQGSPFNQAYFVDAVAPSEPEYAFVLPYGDDSVTVSGLGASPNSTIEVTFPDAGNTVVVIPVNSSGAWTVDSNIVVPPGDHVFSCVNIDAASNRSLPKLINYTQYLNALADSVVVSPVSGSVVGDFTDLVFEQQPFSSSIVTETPVNAHVTLVTSTETYSAVNPGSAVAFVPGQYTKLSDSSTILASNMPIDNYAVSMHWESQNAVSKEGSSTNVQVVGHLPDTLSTTLTVPNAARVGTVTAARQLATEELLVGFFYEDTITSEVKFKTNDGATDLVVPEGDINTVGIDSAFVSDTNLLLSNPGYTVGATGRTGAIWSYGKVGGDWSLEQTITIPNFTGTGGYYGNVIDGDGDWFATNSHPFPGGIDIYRKVAGTWTLYHTIPSPSAETTVIFAKYIILKNDKLYVHFISNTDPAAGVYIYVPDLPNSAWVLEQYIAAPYPGTTSTYMAVDGNKLMVSGLATSGATSGSSVRVYSENNGIWTHSQIINDENPAGYLGRYNIAFSADNGVLAINQYVKPNGGTFVHSIRYYKVSGNAYNYAFSVDLDGSSDITHIFNRQLLLIDDSLVMPEPFALAGAGLVKIFT